MSKVLERKMFAKQAKKFAEGGEVSRQAPAFDMEAVTVPRSQRERMATELLGRDLGYSLLAQGDRPMLTRPTATGMPQMAPPQGVPPQMQAAQMQQLAQAGMLPRFQEGGEVSATEVPSMWSSIRERLAMPFRERTGPILDPNTGEPVEFIDPNSTIDTFMSEAVPALLPMARGARGLGSLGRRAPVEPTTPKGPGPWEADRTTGPWSKPTLPTPRAQPPEPKPPGPTGPSIPGDTAPGTSVPQAGTRLPPASTPRQGGSWLERFGRSPASRLPDVPEEIQLNREDEMEREREANRAAAFKNIAQPEAPKEATKRGDRLAPAPPAAPPPTGRKDTDLENIKAARQENMWLAMMQAGLAIAGGRSPNAITNIGQGGQAGLASFMALEQQRRRDEDAAMRRAVAEREVNLQEQRLNMMAPYYQAQTAYLQARPSIEAARLQNMREAAFARARNEARKAWDNEYKNNMAKYAGKDPAIVAAERDLFIQREAQQLAPGFMQQFMYGGGQAAESGTTPPEE